MAARSVALVGANGFVGKAFAKEFLNQGIDLRILTRSDSINSAPLQEFKSKGASLHAISYDDESSIIKALQGVDVLVSTVAGAALVSTQVPLIKAAESAGVKLFVPSEYGSIFEGASFPIGYDFANKVTVWGDGNAKSTWTTVHSVGDWLANVLKTVPISQLENKHLRIQGNTASANEVIKLWEQKHNAKLQVDYRPLKELDDRVSASGEDFFAVLLQEWSSGRGEIGAKDNGLYPGWNPDPIESIL